MVMTLALLLVLVNLAECLPLSQTQREAECEKFQSAFHTFCTGRPVAQIVRQGRPGKLGPVGEKGERGERGSQGEKGEAGEVDYDVVKAMMNEKLQIMRDEYLRNISEMTRQLTAANERIDVLGQTDICPVNYEGKCFWLESKRITPNQATDLCASRGGKPANIYSEWHHYMIMGYLRTKVDRSKYTDAVVGLIYKEDANTLTLSDGSAVSYVKWYPGHPSSHAGSSVGLIAREPIDNNHQHFFRSRSTGHWRGAICERNY